MQLQTYISDLLYRYDCVTVPNFGAFLTQHVSATIHESTNAFYPPKKQLSFNENIKANDGVLAHYIANAENISFEYALEKIAKQVNHYKSTLAEGNTLSFENIGDLALNSEDKIEFNPSYHLNYLTDAFGLSQFVSPEITREVYKEEAEVIEETIPVAFTPEKRNSKSYFKYAAVALIALTVGGFSFGNYYVSDIEKHNQLAQEEANTKLESKIQEATFVINNPLPAVKLKVNKEAGNYHIIAGAFRIESNCNKKISELQALGFNARKIGVNKHGLFQVAYASYDDRTEALKALRDIKNTNNANAWLLVKDLK